MIKRNRTPGIAAVICGFLMTVDGLVLALSFGYYYGYFAVTNARKRALRSLK